MARVLIAGLIAMVIAVAVGPYFIAWLKRQSIGQQIREEGPAGHVVKAGTPTMGGLLILVAALVPALIVSLYTVPGITIILATLGCGLIGFADDYLSVRRRRSLGLSGRWKLAGLVLITAGVGWATTQVGYMDTEIYFPLVDVNIDLGWAYYPFLFLVIAATRMRRPPIVGVPCLTMWLAGPSSRMCCPIDCLRSHSMNVGPTATAITIATSPAMRTLTMPGSVSRSARGCLRARRRGTP